MSRFARSLGLQSSLELWSHVAVVAAVCTVVLALTANVLRAQTPVPPPSAPPEAPAAPEPVEATPLASTGATAAAPPGEMVVTGSRLHDPVGEQAPVLSLTQAELARPGLVSTGDVLQQLPESGGAINGKYNSSGNFGAPPDGGGIGAGAIEMDLRYLGSKRVLVIVDGVRWVNGSSASGVAASVDLNTIPLGMIERIEVLEDGASPVYGSDAIAGVVNIITKKKFDGLAASAYLGGYAPFNGMPIDGLTQNYDLTLGNTTDRLSIVFGASYMDQGEVSSADREISDSVVPTLENCEFGCSSATPQGRLVFTDPMTGESQDLTLNDGVAAPQYPGDYSPFADSDRFNYAPYNMVLTPLRRINTFTNAIYRFTDHLNFHGKAVYTRRESANRAAPEPLFVGPEGGTGTRMDRIGIHATNPYNPFGFTFDPANPFVVTRRPLEAGPRFFEQTVNTLYLSGGLDGDFKLGERPFNWDTTLAYGINRADQRRKNAFNSAKLQQALGPAFMDADGNFRCGTMDAPGSPECVPFNIFGGQGPNGAGTITRSMLDYVTYTQHDASEQHLLDWLANVNGELADLPGGPLAVGLGVEYRDLSGYFEPDAVVAAGDSADVPALPTSGDYSVTEFYAETRIPFLANLPGISLLDLNAAGRVSDYSFLEPELTGRLGGRYKPIDDLVLRGSYGWGFRAPSIGELHASASRFDAQIIDPCSDFNDASDATRQRCIELGVPPDGSYSQLNNQISVQTGGNPELQPERSSSLSLSVAFAPEAFQDRGFSDRFDVELAYYDIRIDDAITARDAQLQLNDCVGGDDTACEGITRSVTGAISSFSNELLNIGGIETRGFDLKLGFQTPRYGFGRLKARWLSTWMLDYWEKIGSSTGVRTVKLEGKVSGEPERAFPQFKANLLLEWVGDEVSVGLTTRYIHSVTEPCQGFTELETSPCSDPSRTPEQDNLSTNLLRPKVYNDVRVTWMPAFDERLVVNVGVNNVFNVDPPNCFSCSLNGFAPGTYDIPGVFGYINAGYHLQ